MHGGISAPWPPRFPAISSTRFGFVSPRALQMPRSVWGKASGQPRARIAMYCAVHSPMPGRSRRPRHRCLHVAACLQADFSFGDGAPEG